MKERICWDGSCEEGINLCCKCCEKYETCTDACNDTKCMEDKHERKNEMALYR